MPFGDGTGPMGLGPMTGRRMGYCAGFSTPGFMNPYFGRGFWGRGFGMGRGFGRMYWMGFNPYYLNYYGYPYYPTPPQNYPAYPQAAEFSPEDEKEILKQQAEMLKRQLQDIQNRIDILEKEG